MKGKVGIIFGGSSTDRAGSMRSARQAYTVLDRALFEPLLLWKRPQGGWLELKPGCLMMSALQPYFLDGAPDLPDHLVKKIASDRPPLRAEELGNALDLAWLVTPDRETAAALDQQGVPYTGYSPPVEREAELLASYGSEEGAPAEGQPLSFACLVVRRDDRAAVALPPVDERGELLEGDALLLVRRRCERLFEQAEVPTLAVLRGEVHHQGLRGLSLHLCPSLEADGLLFSSLAQIGLNGSQALTFLLSSCLQGAIARQPDDDGLRVLLRHLSEGLRTRQNASARRVGVLMGGQGHLSRFSLLGGRNVFHLLGAMPNLLPIPLLLVTTQAGRIRVLQLPLSDLYGRSLPALSGKPAGQRQETQLEIVRDACKPITDRYGSPGQVMVRKGLNEASLARSVDGIFLQTADATADDGRIQSWLTDAGIPFTGPDAASIRICGDLTLANKVLQHQGLPVPAFEVVRRSAYTNRAEAVLHDAEAALRYPLLARPASGRSSHLARRLHNRQELEAYLAIAFGLPSEEAEAHRASLKLPSGDDFPPQQRLLITDVPAAGNPAFHWLLVGLTSRWRDAKLLEYDIFPGREITAESEAAGAFAPAEERPLSRQAIDLLEQAATALNLQGLAELELLMLDDAQGQALLELGGVRSLPLLHPGHPLLSMAQAAGVGPHELMQRELAMAFERGQTARPADAARSTAPSKATGSVTPETAAREPAPTQARRPLRQPDRPPPGRAEGGLLGRLRQWGRNSLRFLTSSFFLRNLALLGLFLLALLFMLQVGLQLYTHHGESMEVGDYVGKQLDDVRRMAARNNFRPVVIDSVFMVDREPNVVLEQDPEPHARVKKNRRIYLTITSGTAPLVQLPPLEGAYNYDQYRRKMLRLGLRPRVLDRRYDNRQEDNTILYLMYEGDRISEEDLSASGGVKVPKGSEVGFVVTERITEEVPVPDLVCKGYQEAAFILNASELVIGEINGEVPDRTTAYVYQQEPEAGAMIEKGTRVDIYLSLSPPPECDTEN